MDLSSRSLFFKGAQKPYPSTFIGSNQYPYLKLFREEPNGVRTPFYLSARIPAPVTALWQNPHNLPVGPNRRVWIGIAKAPYLLAGRLNWNTFAFSIQDNATVFDETFDLTSPPIAIQEVNGCLFVVTRENCVETIHSFAAMNYNGKLTKFKFEAGGPVFPSKQPFSVLETGIPCRDFSGITCISNSATEKPRSNKPIPVFRFEIGIPSVLQNWETWTDATGQKYKRLNPFLEDGGIATATSQMNASTGPEHVISKYFGSFGNPSGKWYSDETGSQQLRIDCLEPISPTGLIMYAEMENQRAPGFSFGLYASNTTDGPWTRLLQFQKFESYINAPAVMAATNCLSDASYRYWELRFQPDNWPVPKNLETGSGLAKGLTVNKFMLIGPDHG